ncbi:ABC transporter substrate-binding protein [Gordonia sp. DT30]|uniref:ABC transporter substrate-binding protein n=1 Tax=Gordonia sp. DT30 TaxID=3416546 RepID=UPI003CEF7A86
MRWVHTFRFRVVVLAIATASALALAGCGSSADKTDNNSLSVQLSWFKNAQSGGWTTAITEGYLADEGFHNVDIRAGGPNVSTLTLLASGKADIAVATMDSYLQARDKGIPLTAVYNEFSTAPTGIFVKKSTGWTQWKDLANKTWTVAPIDLGWQWVKKSQGIDFKTQNFNGSNAAFMASPDAITQGYPTNTVYEARQHGFELNYLGYASAGFNPYGQILVVTKEFANKHKDELDRALRALSKGWTAYLTNVTAAKKANEQIIKDDDQLAADVNWFTWDAQRKYVIGTQGGKTMGAMTDSRWNQIVSQMKQMGALSQGFNATDLFDNEFVPDVKMPTIDQLPPAPAGVYQGPPPVL